MQHYQCYVCRKEALGGGSLIYDGMFFKLCAECLEDEEAIRLMNEQWQKIDEEDIDESQEPSEVQ